MSQPTVDYSPFWTDKATGRLLNLCPLRCLPRVPRIIRWFPQTQVITTAVVLYNSVRLPLLAGARVQGTRDDRIPVCHHCCNWKRGGKIVNDGLRWMIFIGLFHGGEITVAVPTLAWGDYRVQSKEAATQTAHAFAFTLARTHTHTQWEGGWEGPLGMREACRVSR